ncbi:FAD-dependent oxidoreductase [Neptuniibacter sp.]|uniref:FAD-dependent oxidoreductase n=1 Tax=Neptuniibacter sp. TaxID=1962643 RepID=UPI00261B314C|nr:FAD-dependent oxidoreductase [Neptuniibacter sp.]MCP4598008.1 FAD-dependent oxidoreductase [Neptuniibacter sp.]
MSEALPKVSVGADKWDEAIIVVGAGPVGFRFIQELRKNAPQAPVILFGNEPYLPYDRVRLSALLAGQDSTESLLLPLDDLENDPLFKYLCKEITAINTDWGTVMDSEGTEYSYSKLVLATGSRAHVPHIKGVEMDGVFTFRNMRDAEKLKARTTRSQDLVVVGGGLLGLEAAKAMQGNLTNITLVQQANRIMNQQLDDVAAAALQEKLEAMGIRVVVGAGVKGVVGEHRVEGVALRNGETIQCDTVLLSAGIKPNIELARKAWIKVGRGIRVNDQLQTSHPDIYAIGECAEHREKVYGLVAPGFEQAAVAANHITQGGSQYLGSHSIARLKVVGEAVFSMGDVLDEQQYDKKKFITYTTKEGSYRKLALKNGRLVGAMAIGEWDEIPRIQELITHKRRLFPWQLLRFRMSGNVWSPSSNSPEHWPETAVICNCNNVTRGQLSYAIEHGCCSVDRLAQATGASTTCGTCKPLVQQMLGSEVQQEAEPDKNSLLGTSLAVATALLAFLLIPALTVSTSVQEPLRLDLFWNDGFYKQVSGFTLLGLTVIGLLMSLKKRSKALKFGSYKLWRSLHTVLAVFCLLILLVHTGFNSGQALNQWLLIDFLLLAFLGAFVSVAIGMQHKFSPSVGLQLRKISFWGHLLLSWPLPALLSFHILSVYYF